MGINAGAIVQAVKISCLVFALWAVVALPESAAQVTTEYPGTPEGGWLPTPPSGAIAAFQTDLFSGSGSTSIPIVVPPGANGIQPSLALVYNSGLRQNTETIVAPGWDLIGLGYIERNMRYGVPTYTTSDRYALVLNGANDLVFVSADGRYHTKDESYLRIEFISGSDYWRVTDKRGTQYRFGGVSNSRSTAIGRSETRRWALDQVTDMHNNQMSISYINDTVTGAIYPDTITYTQGNGLTKFRTVEFHYEPRSYRPTEIPSYRSASKVVVAQRLAYIDVKMNGAMVRRYELTYAPGSSSKSDLVTNIKEYGADATPGSRGTGTSLPATQYSYAASPNNFSGGGSTPWLQPSASKALTADFTGDGLADFAYCEDDGNGWHIAASTGSGFSTPGPVFAVNCANPAIISLGDFNGDGKADLARAGQYAGGGTAGVWVNFSTGTDFGDINGGFNARVDWLTYTTTVRTSFGDMDADGKMDIIYTWHQDAQPSTACPSSPCEAVYVAHFDSAQQQMVYSGPHYYDDSASPVLWTRVIDLNGDNLPDLMQGRGAPDNGIYVRLNSSPGCATCLSTPIQWFAGSPPIDALYALSRWRFGDFNGDGLVDLVVLDGTPAVRHADAYLNTGMGFSAPLSWLNVTGSWYTTAEFAAVQVGDFNGDGKADLVDCQGSTPSWDVHLSTGIDFYSTGSGIWQTAQTGTCANYAVYLDDYDGNGHSDLAEIYYAGTAPYDVNVHLAAGPPIHAVTNITNSYGGTVSVAYDFKPVTRSSGGTIRSMVVSSRLQNGLAGSTISATYSYLNGRYDIPTREFRGFGEVTVTDAANNYTKTTFLQTNELRGRPSQVERYDFGNALQSKTVNTWNYDTLSGTAFPFLKQTDAYSYHANGTDPLHASTVFYYDSFGNVVKIESLGDVSNSTDDRFDWTEYNYNTSAWIIGLPIYQATTSDSIGANFAAETDYYYDNATDPYTPPTKGDVTKVCRIDLTATPPCALFGYDAFGNRTNVTDPRGYPSSVEYDLDYHTFPITATNALNQSIATTYWGINTTLTAGSIDSAYAVPGLVATVTDPNGLRVDSYWDAFGRARASVVPPDTTAAPTAFYVHYRDGVVPEAVLTKGREDVGAGTVDSYIYFDGLGRPIQSKTESPDGAFQVVTDTTYDSRGLVSTGSNPYLRPTSGTYTTPDPFVLGTSTAYDPLRRAVLRTFPDGTQTNQIYDRWSTFVFDPNGRQTLESRDAFGRLEAVQEYTGADGRDSSTPSEAYSLYGGASYGRDLFGNLTTTNDTLNNRATMTYDPLGRKIAMHDPDMGDWSYGYDAAGNLTSQTDAKQQTIIFTYDELNRLKTKLVSGQTTTYNYDTAPNGIGRMASVSDPTGTTSFSYDLRGRITQTVKVVGGQSYTIQQAFDSLDRVTSLTYPDNETVSYSYDAAGNLKSVGSYATNISYNAAGQRTSITLGNGTQTTYTYNPANFRLERLKTTGVFTGGSAPNNLGFESCTTVDADPPGWTVSAAANSGCMGQPYHGSWSAYVRTSAYMSQPITLAVGTTYTVSVYARAASGQNATVLLSSLPNGGTTYCTAPGVTVLTWTLMTCTYTPTATGTAYLTLKAANTSTALAYFDLASVTTGPAASNVGFESCTTLDADPPGWSVSTQANTGCTNAAKHSGAWSAQARASTYLSQPITVTPGLTYTVSAYVQNSASGQTATLQLSSAPGGGTSYCSQSASATTWTLLICSYTPAVSGTAYVNFKSGASATVYARFDSLLIAVGPAASNQGFESCASVGADPPGWSVSNAANTGCASTTPHTGLWRAEAKGSAYLSQPVTVTNGLQYRFAVYAKNSASGQTATLQVSSAAGGGTTYCSPPATALTTWTLLACDYTASSGTAYISLKAGASTAVLAHFDTVSVTQVNPGDPQNLAYTYDSAGNVTSIRDDANSASSESLITYDHLHRLLSVSGPYGNVNYAYDTIGNMICNSQLSACSGTSPNYGYPQSGPASVRPHAVTTAGSNSYFYDANGNMSSGAGRTFGHNAEDQVTSLTVGTTTTTMTYDYSGARVTKSVNGGTPTIYIGDLYECAATCTKYIFAGGTRIAHKNSGTVSYFHPNHLGSTHFVTNASGSSVEEIHYNPYGSTWSDTGSVSMTYKYTDQEEDWTTGLYYYDARYYDPVLGRFTSPDWIGFSPSDPQTANRYSYVVNNPLRYTDPSGHAHTIEIDYPGDVTEDGKQITTIILLPTVPAWDDSGTSPDVVVPFTNYGPADAVNDWNKQIAAARLAATWPAVQDYWRREAAGEFCNGLCDGTGRPARIPGLTASPGWTGEWVNPTGGPVRGCDNFGCGQFGASRNGITGPRLHSGTDFVANPGQNVAAITSGRVAKVGYPYGDDLSYRYIEIETQTGYRVRELYVSPSKGISQGVAVSAGQVIGTQQPLARRYPGITEHVHVEIKYGGKPINPIDLIPVR